METNEMAVSEYSMEQFINDEIREGTPFEEILEKFDLTPGEVFIHLWDSGLIDDQVLEGYILDIN